MTTTTTGAGGGVHPEPPKLTRSPASQIIKEQLLPAVSGLVKVVTELRSEVHAVRSQLIDHAARLNSTERQLGELEEKS